MKTLADGTHVSDYSYYFLLAWNEQNKWFFMQTELQKKRLCDLNKDEYKILFQKAMGDELSKL